MGGGESTPSTQKELITEKYLCFSVISTKYYEQKSNIFYEFTVPGFQKKYIGKTDCCIEHATKDDQPLRQHFTSCVDFFHLGSKCLMLKASKVVSATFFTVYQKKVLQKL